MRLGLIWRNSTSASGATFTQLAGSFWYGLRFDLAIACYIALPLLVIAHVPGFGFWTQQRLRRIAFWIMTAVVIGIVFILLAEYEFFREFQTRFNQLAFQYLDQPRIVVGMAWYNYPVLRYVLICLAVAAGWALSLYAISRVCFGRIGQKHAPVHLVGQIGQYIALIALVVIGMRGGLQHEPLRWGNAYHSQNDFVNEMSLNGVFALATSGIDHFSPRRESITSVIASHRHGCIERQSTARGRSRES
jgi:phosphoglycerol transferase MdoB-like AlkP superfamily enzyme